MREQDGDKEPQAELWSLVQLRKDAPDKAMIKQLTGADPVAYRC